MTRTVDKLIERLALLASGEMPSDPFSGICADVRFEISKHAKDMFQRTLRDMGLHPIRPLGGRCYVNYGWKPAWNKRLGPLRRDLCKRAVYHLVRTYGYNGDWA